jgi:hypothetical protein|tara:strand:+ start:737 stop:934 length:198 start_codon:yes stop_codon:yes gene_type:complete
MSNRRTQPYRHGVPAKYLKGLSPTEAKKRAAEIKRTAKAYKEGKRVNIAAVSKSRAKSGRKNKIT